MLGFAFPGLSGKVNGGATGIKDMPLTSKIHPVLESSLIPRKTAEIDKTYKWPKPTY